MDQHAWLPHNFIAVHEAPGDSVGFSEPERQILNAALCVRPWLSHHLILMPVLK